jgi:hypothetical protein
MKKKWLDPVKGHPAKDSTLKVHGDFQQFTELMKRIIVPAKTSKSQ